MNRIKETSSYDRPREKLFRNGPSYLSNRELLAVMLGSGTKGNDVFQVAKRALLFLEEKIHGAIQDFSQFLQGLSKIKGVGSAKAALIVASFELYTRIINDKGRVISRATDILPYVSYLVSKKQEYFVCITLNGANRLISQRVVTIGLVDQALVHPREVFADAVKERAAKIIVVHNHPAGCLMPSREDRKITETLANASSILGIALLDHVIISKDGYFSFREEGLLKHC